MRHVWASWEGIVHSHLSSHLGDLVLLETDIQTQGLGCICDILREILERKSLAAEGGLVAISQENKKGGETGVADAFDKVGGFQVRECLAFQI
jgi:hypothetical protein